MDRTNDTQIAQRPVLNRMQRSKKEVVAERLGLLADTASMLMMSTFSVCSMGCSFATGAILASAIVFVHLILVRESFLAQTATEHFLTSVRSRVADKC